MCVSVGGSNNNPNDTIILKFILSLQNKSVALNGCNLISYLQNSEGGGMIKYFINKNIYLEKSNISNKKKKGI